MGKVAVVTDSNSGITQSQARELGVFVIPMPFYIDQKLYFEDISLSQEEFYQKLEGDSEISTSQPAIGDVMDLWEQLLKDYDEIVHIPMSSGLSSSYESAVMIAADFDDRVQVVNNQRISVTQRQSVLDAFYLADQGMKAFSIREILEKTRFDSGIYITVDTLKYLKQGGRITAAAAAIGSVLNIKPVLKIKGEKLDAFAKARGMKLARKKMMAAIQEDFDQYFPDGAGPDDLYLQAAYAGNEEDAREWADELATHFPEFELHMDPLSLSVACHIGYGALAVAWCKKISDQT